MMITKSMIDQLGHLLRPLATRIANTVARGVVQLVDDTTKMQLLQVGVLGGETIDRAEHFQPYGMSSVPPPGSELLLLFPNGDRSHPLAFCVANRSSRPTGGQSGDFSIYNAAGARITLFATGDIDVQPAPGGKVSIHDAGAGSALPTMDDFNGIVSIMNSAGTGSATALPAALAAYQTDHPTWPVGTTVLEGE